MNIAILIDAENVLAAHADQIFEHAAALGDIRRREIFGAAQALTSWVEPVLKYAMHANLTIKASKGKNSSDIALVIGAMDLLLEGGIDAAIIASSDSDFSALSVRLRNAGVQVIGMGTEKANPLWRAACSSFTVLQQPARQPAQPPKKAQPKDNKPAAKDSKPQSKENKPQPKDNKPAAKENGAPAEAPATPAAPAVSPDHNKRMDIIREFIQHEIEAAGGRVQTNALFTALNALPEYKVDQQRSRRRPLNYLTRHFSDAFRFEDGPDGNGIVSMRGESAPAEAPAEVPAEAPAEVPAAPAAPAEPVKPAKAAKVPVPAAPAEPAEGAEPLALLLEAGLPEDDAKQIVAIFTDSASLREAYNKLRSVFGSTTGREYYQKVKEIAKANG